MSTFLLGVGFGLVTAAILAISTVALSLQYAVTNVPNFAHGEIMTLGAFVGYSTLQWTHNVPLAVVAAMASGSLFGVAINKLLLSPFRKRNTALLTQFVLTIAVSLIAQNALLWIYGGNTLPISVSGGLPTHVGPFLLTPQEDIIIVASAVIMVGVHLLLRYTMFGKSQRAVAESPSLAQASGISADRVINRTWILTGALAGLAGLVLGIVSGGVFPTIGFGFLLIVFAAAILGGIGQPYGAMAGALVVGVTMEVSALYISPDYKTSVAFAILILALLFRPQGLVAPRATAAA